MIIRTNVTLRTEHDFHRESARKLSAEIGRHLLGLPDVGPQGKNANALIGNACGRAIGPGAFGSCSYL